MKQDLLKATLLAGVLLFSQAANAQLSEGGKPRSFDKFFRASGLIPVAHMPAVDVEPLLAEDAVNDGLEAKPFRFGFNHYTNLELYNSGLWTTLPNGDRVWQLQVKCQDALTVNLSFKDLYIPQGAKLFVYTPDHEFIIGAMTSANNTEEKEQGTDLLPGQEVIVEYYEPAAVAGQGSLNLWRVTHGYRDVSPFVNRVATRGFGDAGSCQNNAKCSISAGWEDQIRSVVCLVSGGSEFCTGALVNNTANDGTPYVLTANHCYSSPASWVFRFNWQSTGCPNPGSSPASNSISGGTLRARNAGTDFCLVQINSTPPAGYNVYYAGWSRSSTPTTATVGIHHPSGDIKKFSTATGTVASTMSGAQCWNVGLWTDGCTEPGSSGSPLFDANHRVIGQLFGGPSACGASSANMNDNYGRFDISWTGGGTSATRLSNWLDPSSTAPTTLDGFDPNATVPGFADDGGISAITSPATGSSTCVSTVTVTATIQNYGTDNLTSATINYKLDAGPVQTQPWTGSLATGATASVSLPALTGLTVGAHTLTIYTSNPNGVTDPNTANDQQVSNFSVTTPTPTAVPTVNNTFQTSFPGTNFSITNGGASDTWVLNSTIGGFGASTRSAMIDNFTNDFEGDHDYINTPYINLTSVTNVRLKFDVAYAPYNTAAKDSLNVWVKVGCDNAPVRVYAKTGTTLATAPAVTASIFQPTASQWRTETIDLSAYDGVDDVRIIFENVSGYGQALYIDNINIASTTGIMPLEIEGSVQLMPNPASTNVSIGLPVVNTAYNISIVNGLGQQMLKTTAAGSVVKTDMDISSLRPGVYFVTIENNGHKAVKKLVKE